MLQNYLVLLMVEGFGLHGFRGLGSLGLRVSGSGLHGTRFFFFFFFFFFFPPVSQAYTGKRSGLGIAKVQVEKAPGV